MVIYKPMKNINTIKFNYNGVSLNNEIIQKIQYSCSKLIGITINESIINILKNNIDNILLEYKNNNILYYYNINYDEFIFSIEYKLYNYDEIISLDIKLR